MSKVNPRASTSDGVSRANRYNLPDDLTEATRLAYEKLKKLISERKQLASRIRDVVQDAKADGYATPMVRQSFKLAGLTPEQLDKWMQQTSQAASLFGIKGLIFDEAEQDKKLWGFVQLFLHLRRERKELSDQFADLREAAKDHKVDYDALVHVVTRLERLDREQREEWLERIDAISTFLGYW